MPLPRKNTIKNNPKYRIGNSFTEKGSAAWTINAATNMTIINGIEANLHLNPRITIYTKLRYQCIISGDDDAIVSFILNEVLVARIEMSKFYSNSCKYKVEYHRTTIKNMVINVKPIFLTLHQRIGYGITLSIIPIKQSFPEPCPEEKE